MSCLAREGLSIEQVIDVSKIALDQRPQHTFSWKNKKNIYMDASLIWSYELRVYTVFTVSIRTPQLLTTLVLKFEQVQFTTRC